MLAIDVCLTIVEHANNHLEVEIQYGLENTLVDIEVGIIDLQHIFLTIFLNQKYLSLARVVTQTLNVSIPDTFQQETIIINTFLLHGRVVGPDSTV